MNEKEFEIFFKEFKSFCEGAVSVRAAFLKRARNEAKGKMKAILMNRHQDDKKPYWGVLDLMSLLHALGGTARGGLNNEMVRWAIQKACENDDKDFFVSLGRRLSQAHKSEPDKLTLFMLAGWVTLPCFTLDGAPCPGLMHFTDEAICDIFHQQFPKENPIDASKVRDRRLSWGLKKVSHCRATVAFNQQGKLVFNFKGRKSPFAGILF
jgi:hypothetical protein